MAIYLFSYDLIDEKGSSIDYQKLYDELARLKAHRVQESLWLVNLNNTPKEVLEHFKGFTDANDKLWVSSVRKNEHWFTNANAGTNKWIESNPPT